MKNSWEQRGGATPHAKANGSREAWTDASHNNTTDSIVIGSIMLVKNNSKKRSIVSWIRFVRVVMTV